MTPEQAAHRILETMLGHLGLAATIEAEENPEGPTLQILSEDSEGIIGPHGERLDDLQYLLNRTLQKHFPKAPRIRVDCGNFRATHEAQLNEEVREMAARVKASGKPVLMRPLNAYYRRLVHNALVDEPEIESISAPGESRLKRITLRKRDAAPS